MGQGVGIIPIALVIQWNVSPYTDVINSDFLGLERSPKTRLWQSAEAPKFADLGLSEAKLYWGIGENDL